MKKITLDANAKINLYLDVTSKRDDGYHNIESVMQSISLSDRVSVSLFENTSENAIIQNFPGSALPCDETNLCYRAAKAYLDFYNIADYHIEITVEKHIPEAAGLAGGSADAAAVIRALDCLYDNNSPYAVLCEIGLKVGSDVAFCIIGGTCAVTGRGENVNPIKSMPELWVVVAKSPNESVSTKEAYKKIDTDKNIIRSKVSFAEYVKALENKDVTLIANGAYNIFESVMSHTLNETNKIIESMKKDGALCSIMSGSGPSVFGLFDNYELARLACDNLKDKYFASVCNAT